MRMPFLLWVLAGLAPAAFAAPLPPPAEQQRARQMFEALVAINTTHSHGSSEAAQLLARWMREGGFDQKDVTFVAPADHPHKGNLVVRLRGKGSGKPVLILGHLDVVEAKREDWSLDPFTLTEKDGYFYGRGSIDMKDGDAALAASLVRLKKEGFVPQRDIIAAFTADEEAGGDANGPAFLLKHHRDLIDASLVLNLDGGGGNLKNGKPLYFQLGTSEKTYLTYTVETTGPGGHGSLPGPDTPIYQLSRGLLRLQALQFPVHLTQTMRSNFQQLADIDPSEYSADMKAVGANPPDAAAAQRLSRNTLFNALLRTTCVATLVSGGHAENALPQRARATIQCRMMPGESEAEVRATLVRTLDDPGIRLTLDAPPIVSPESLPDAAFSSRLTGVVHSMWPGVPIVPAMGTGFSDDRQTRNAGIPSFDVSGIWADIDENRAHGRDERVGVQAFYESVEYTYRLLKAFSH